MDVAVSAAAHAAPVTDFVDAAVAVLRDLRSRVGLDSWVVSRRSGDDWVALAAVDDVLGERAGTVRPWCSTFCARMVDGRAPSVAPDVDLVPAYAEVCAQRRLDVRAVLTVPVLGPTGDLLGSLCAMGVRPRGADLHDHLPAVQVQAGVLGILLAHELRLSLETLRAEQAEDAASTDPLTGLRDRRAWDAVLAAEEARAQRYGTRGAVLVLDLDQLKVLNDSAGHAAGDDLIRRTASMLARGARPGDLVARLGGDEFGVLMQDAGEAEAVDVATELTSTLEAAGVEASAGVAVRRSDGDLHAAWQEADAAMYAEKARRAERRAAALAEEQVPLGPQGHPHQGRQPGRVGSTVLGDRGRLRPWQPPQLDSVDALLRLVREQLDMDVAFVSRVDGETRSFRNVDTRIVLPVEVGYTEPFRGTYCQRIVDGELAEVTPDAFEVPALAALPVTRRLEVRAHVGVPLRRRDGTLFGTLCAFSRTPDTTLKPRDAEVLRTVGEVIVDLADREDALQGERRAVVDRLDRLAATGGPRMVFQPVKTLGSRETVGVEALSRFPAGTPNPRAWFTTAAEVGLGTDLELRALSGALAALPLVPGYLSVNCSPATVLTPGFARQLADVPLDRLVLEITEHEPVADYAELSRALRPWRRDGLRLAVDDAGAGFASMRHVVTLEPELIKLDISLVHDVDTQAPRRAMAAAMGAFAATMGASVVAEGIETAEELRCLRALGIRYGQGYHLARPAALPGRG